MKKAAEINLTSKKLVQLKAIDEYLEFHNANPKPSIWTKTDDKILTKLSPL